LCYARECFRAAHCLACHGVRSHLVPVALVGECSIPLMQKVARQPFSSYRVSCRSKPWRSMARSPAPIPRQGSRHERSAPRTGNSFKANLESWRGVPKGQWDTPAPLY